MIASSTYTHTHTHTHTLTHRECNMAAGMDAGVHLSFGRWSGHYRLPLCGGFLMDSRWILDGFSADSPDVWTLTRMKKPSTIGVCFVEVNQSINQSTHPSELADGRGRIQIGHVIDRTHALPASHHSAQKYFHIWNIGAWNWIIEA